MSEIPIISNRGETSFIARYSSQYRPVHHILPAERSGRKKSGGYLSAQQIHQFDAVPHTVEPRTQATKALHQALGTGVYHTTQSAGQGTKKRQRSPEGKEKTTDYAYRHGAQSGGYGYHQDWNGGGYTRGVQSATYGHHQGWNDGGYNQGQRASGRLPTGYNARGAYGGPRSHTYYG